MNKHTKPEQIIEAIKLADEAGIGFAGNLIFGDKGETEDTIRESMSFYFRHGIDPFIFISFVNPYPGSELYKYCEQIGLIKDKAQFYEHIDEGIMNMTDISNSVFVMWCKFLLGIEQSYTMIKSVNGEYEPDGEYHKVYANCPHCGYESFYREKIGKKSTFIVTGCQSCNKRIRVNILR
jgi:predicted RNA-binding Zn-ribbon protein involved in translation (DUF1610 family)